MDIFSTNVLAKVVERLHTPSSFLLDTFFPNVQTSDKEEIFFDVTDSKPRISPFVSPLLPGKVVDSGGYQTKSFKPAYVKDKRRFDANIPYKRVAGEIIGGSLSPSGRYERALATTLTDQLENLTRREEVMAAEILRTGQVVVSGDGYPSTTVNFGRDAALTKALTGSATWETAAVNPINDLGKSGLFYLTDNTNLEKQTVIGLLGRYASELNANDINSILKVVYPDLYSYMGEYNFEHPLLKGYFQAYKYQKLFNHISSDFAKVVEEQAVKREYNSILRPRVSYLEKIDTKNTMVYFVDALGVEYLSFILAQCNSNNLFANVTVCRSELPSITCMNKEFVDVFSSAGCKIIDIKDLDELKHHGTNDFDYQITKEPIHLIEELNIIATVLEKIRTNIASGKCEKAIIISDHGASRLAVINETENKYEMSEKGEHSGRCCPVSDIDEKPDFATEENGYWVLANYDRFKGGRKANVEVHGGAALEEVCVPIIEITPQNEKIDVRLLDSYKNITVSFRKSALIKFFINKKLNNLKVKIEGKYYDAQPTAEEFVYQVSMPDIRKAKNYIFDVYASENMIASGLQFNVKSEVTVEKDLF